MGSGKCLSCTVKTRSSTSEVPAGNATTVCAGASPGMDAERGKCVPRIRAVGKLGVKFNGAQAVGRSLSVLFELGALCIIAWLYSYWKTEPTTRVDILFPSFFPVVVGIAADTYEVVSLLFMNRKRAINPVAVCFDVALIGTGIFCFLVLSMVERGAGERRAYWVTDITNAMVFMIVFSMIHAGFIILAAGGIIHIYFSTNKERRDVQLARSQAEMVQFSERRGGGLQSQPTVA
ncbi:hypothetical protein C8A00DRAFT_40927 [Chaetomidium leptoderma]|uniref:Uncharacterized protein n=1 Tax=Chaetomidium leptoderma TaxID=669021 RepID=A0AAN6VSU9_9PEZI|nr:hypothetical protein C8A00DRAFT_40927 [Chaetomidium leptoderma]